MLLKWFGFAVASVAVARMAGAWSVGAECERAVLPGGARFVECELREGERTARLHAVIFQQARCTLRVIDRADPADGSLATAMSERGMIAGVNGGYFHDDFRPVGLEIADGRVIHRFESAKLLSGVLAITARGPALLRAHEYKPSPKITDALQAGPFLVDHGTAVAGLNAVKRARRTVVASNGRGGWALLVFSPVTLAEAAGILASRANPAGWKIERALNLDGGSSTGIWVAAGPRPFYLAELAAVRNYLGLAPK